MIHFIDQLNQAFQRWEGPLVNLTFRQTNCAKTGERAVPSALKGLRSKVT